MENTLVIGLSPIPQMDELIADDAPLAVEAIQYEGVEEFPAEIRHVSRPSCSSVGVGADDGELPPIDSGDSRIPYSPSAVESSFRSDYGYGRGVISEDDISSVSVILI